MELMRVKITSDRWGGPSKITLQNQIIRASNLGCSPTVQMHGDSISVRLRFPLNVSPPREHAFASSNYRILVRALHFTLNELEYKHCVGGYFALHTRYIAVCSECHHPVWQNLPPGHVEGDKIPVLHTADVCGVCATHADEYGRSDGGENGHTTIITEYMEPEISDRPDNAELGPWQPGANQGEELTAAFRRAAAKDAASGIKGDRW